MHRIRRARLFFAASMSLLIAVHSGATHAVEAPELKVAIVYNVLQFVEWPADTEAASHRSELTLCVDSGGQLSAFFKSLAGRPVNMRRLAVIDLEDGPEGWKRCDALFIDATGKKAGAIAARLPHGAPVLLLGDQADVRPGHATPMVQLVEASGRIAFNIDLAAARQCRLQVSSRLLRLARKVVE